jgi:hypothetical protein
MSPLAILIGLVFIDFQSNNLNNNNNNIKPERVRGHLTFFPSLPARYGST